MIAAILTIIFNIYMGGVIICYEVNKEDYLKMIARDNKNLPDHLKLDYNPGMRLLNIMASLLWPFIYSFCYFIIITSKFYKWNKVKYVKS
jgi:hypothetical protein